MNILANVQSMPKGGLNIEKISQAQTNQKMPENNQLPMVKESDYKPDIFDSIAEKVVYKRHGNSTKNNI